MKMRSNRPYLIRALYDWIVDNGCTPYVMVDAGFPGVEVPQEFVTDGQIVLNIAPRAVQNFNMNIAFIEFSTRFGGVPRSIYLPTGAILGIYARENGQGMVFDPDSPDSPPPADRPRIVRTQRRENEKEKGKPALRVVK